MSVNRACENLNIRFPPGADVEQYTTNTKECSLLERRDQTLRARQRPDELAYGVPEVDSQGGGSGAILAG